MNFKERRKRARRNAWAFRISTIVVGVVLMAIAVWLGRSRFGTDIWENLYMEGISIVLTILIIDVLNRWRDERNAEEALVQRLELSVRSKVEQVATQAMEDLITLGLVTGEDGLFSKVKGYDLSNIRLSKLDLRGANFSGVQMQKARILDADLSVHPDGTITNLSDANCEEMMLTGCNLTGANLHGANFKNARFIAANLSHTQLDSTDLRGANLSQACFVGANLEQAILDETTILPDAMQMAGEYEQTYVRGMDLSLYTIPPSEGGYEAAGCE